MDRRSPSPDKRPLDQCKPEDMVSILLTRLKDNPLGEENKALLIVELEDLYLFFQKHPEHVNMFLTDLIEWRTFLKQSKEYMEEFFDKKLSRTRKIIQFIRDKTEKPTTEAPARRTHTTVHYKTKSHRPKDWDPKSPEPTFYEILFRPGIRSIREYPITEERYGEHNQDIDQLHKLTAMLREEIIYAPLSKVSSKTKEELLRVLISVVEISAYDVLHGIIFLEQLAHLVKSISEGDDSQMKTNTVDVMKKITANIKDHARQCSTYSQNVKIFLECCSYHDDVRSVWEKNKATEKQMWENITAITKKVEQGKIPKFDQEILTKSNFLRMEKMKGGRPAEYPIVIEAAESDVERTVSTQEVSPEPMQLIGPPPSRITPSHESVLPVKPSKPCIKCDEYRQRYGDDFLKAMKEPEKKFKIQEIPEAKEEKETLFKMKHVPKFDYALLRTVNLPTQPDLFDVTDALKAALRLYVGPETGEFRTPEGVRYKSVRNPYVNRKRLLKY